MKKKVVILLLCCALIILFVGCNGKIKTEKLKNENNIVENTINKSYIFKAFKGRSAVNKQSGYEVNDTIICYLNKYNLESYIINSGKTEYLKLVDKKLDSDGLGITYSLKSQSNDKYSLYVKGDGKSQNIKCIWKYPNNSEEEFSIKLMDKKACETKILDSFCENEINELANSGFEEKSQLGICAIQKQIENAKEILYKKTNTNRNQVNYTYVYFSEDSDINAKYYTFRSDLIDEKGDTIGSTDSLLLVKREDESIYKIYPKEENEKKYNIKPYEKENDKDLYKKDDEKQCQVESSYSE